MNDERVLPRAARERWLKSREEKTETISVLGGQVREGDVFVGHKGVRRTVTKLEDRGTYVLASLDEESDGYALPKGESYLVERLR